MTGESSNKISDIVKPENEVIPLLHGKKAVIGPISLEILCWIEEKYGDWMAFGEEMKKAKISSISEFMFVLIENQEDFDNIKHFRRCFPMEKLVDIIAIINRIGDLSMPATSEVSNADSNSEGKKP